MKECESCAIVNTSAQNNQLLFRFEQDLTLNQGRNLPNTAGRGEAKKIQVRPNIYHLCFTILIIISQL